MAKTSSRKLFSKRFILALLNVIVIAGLAGLAGHFYQKYNNLKNQSPESIQKSQVEQTVSKVAKLYDLPKDEEPDVATVKDKEALKKQYPFFDQAENDDVVLIYKNAKVAILYRPSSNKVIKAGPVNVESGLSIKTVGSAADRAAVEKKLTESNLTFTAGGAIKTAVTGIVVVDIKGTNSEQAKKLAEVVGGTVGALPEGEDKPTDADLLILVGPPATDSVNP